MLQFVNRTPFQGTITLFPDADGIDTLFTIVKGTFAIVPGRQHASIAVAEEQAPVTLAPEYWGEPGRSSIRRPSDLSLQKPGTDVLVTGSAHAMHGEPVRVLDVMAQVGPVRRFARVFGERVWERSGGGYTMSMPQPFTSVPLVWERAFGGRDRTESGPVPDARNPVGTGYHAPDGLEPIEGSLLPNVEDPAAPISSWKEQPPPAGFAPLDAFWEPRRSFAGTYDERWRTSRAPYLPEDFDPRFLQLAPPDLVVAGHLQGGEWADLRGMTPGGVLQFQIPTLRPRVLVHVDDEEHDRPAALDTVIIEPDAGRLTLVWRAALPCDKRALRVREVEASLPHAA